MKDYLGWSVRQFYLMYFWPTRFKSEVESADLGQMGLGLKERAWYMLKMLPWLVIVNVFSSLAVWFICMRVGIDFRWKWIGVVFGIAVGMAIGVVGNVFVGVVFGMFYSTAEGMAYGLAFAVAYGLTLGLAFSMGYFVVGRVKGGLALGMMFGVVGGAVNGEAGGVAGCVALWFAYFRLFTYPLDVVLSLFAYLYGKRSPQTIERAWRLCPVVWNEVIWLPLPFAAKLLTMLTIQDRKEGFRQIAFVAAERRLQTQVASHASEEIAINDLQATSIKELANVTQELDWTTDAPSEMPEVLVTAFPRFERTAQYTDQYFKLHSNHRKAEALKQALSGIEGLQKSLIAASGRLASRLLQTANAWRVLLEAEQEAFVAKSIAVREIPNPFVYGKGVVETEHNIFAGRRDIVEQIEASVLGALQAPTLLLHGPRRMGKTSILNQLPRLLGPEFAPSIVNCQNPALRESAPRLLQYLSRALTEGLRRRRVIVESLSATALRREPFSVFDQWLDQMEQAMPNGIRALLCFDEYEELQETLDAGWGGAFLDALRHTLQYRERAVLLFAGAHTFQELGKEWTDRFISARRVRVSFLTREEVYPLLTRPIPAFTMTYSPGAFDALFAATSGQPFLTQATAFDLVQLLNQQQRTEATPEDVETAVSRTLVSGGEYFASVWNDAGMQGQAILRAIARGESPPEAEAARAWLREHDVLGSDGNFAVEMVRRWVKINSF